MVGLGGLEPPTSPLSAVCSSQLSYRPELGTPKQSVRLRNIYSDPPTLRQATDQVICVSAYVEACLTFSLKEVIQPQVPLRLPCYDFTPVIDHTVVGALLAVRLPTSGTTNSHGVTGGVYKAPERIPRRMLIRHY